MLTRTVVVLFLAIAHFANAQPTPETVALVDSLTEASYQAGSPAEGEAVAGRALELAREAGYREGQARALYAQGQARFYSGQRGAGDLFAESARVARQAGDRATEGTALAWHGIDVLARGDRVAGLEISNRAVAVHESIEDDAERTENVLVSLNLLSKQYETIGDRARALEVHRRVLSRAREAGLRGDAVLAAVNLGDYALDAGDIVGAVRYYDIAEELSQEEEAVSGEAPRVHNIAAGRARIEAAFGRMDQAAVTFRRLARARLEEGNRGFASGYYDRLGNLYRDAGQFADAAGSYGDAYDVLEGTDLVSIRYGYRVKQAGALFDAGRDEEARRLLQPAADSVLAGAPLPDAYVVALTLLAREARLAGRHGEAARLALDAAVAAEESGLVREARDAYAERAAALEAAGNPAGALEAFRQSTALSDSLTDQAQAREVGRLQAEATFEDERQAAASRRQQLVWGLAAVLVLAALAALGTTLYLRAVRRQRTQTEAQAAALEDANATLAETNGDLEVANRMLADARETQARSFQAISHEVRTPLTLAAGPVADLARGLHGALPDAARDAVGTVQRSLSRLGRLIDDLLDAARLDAGQAPHRPEPGDLAALVRRTAATFEAHAEREAVDLEVVTPDLFPATFDPVALERSLGNVLANALRHTPTGGRVRVALEAGGGSARVSVADTGPGVPADHLPHLFDRFYRADERAGVGSGLGLSLASEWMAHHGGHVEVESEPGAGATFTLVLPLEDVAVVSGDSVSPPSPTPTVDTALEDAGDSDALVVLVAEDNAEVRAYVASHLARVGGAGFSEPVRVLEAGDGQAALQAALEAVPDLVVSDVMMPTMDGVELTAALKADARTSHVPVLLLTARADAEGRVAGFEAGADGYLAKPFDPEALRAQAAALVAERRRLRDWFSAHAGDGASVDGSALEVAAPEPALAPLDREFVRRVDAQIAARLGDGGFGATQLAADLDLSERQLRRKLKAITGETPGARLRRCRIEAGASFLEAGTHSVKEAAAAVGYADAEGFRRAFVALRGHQPSEAGLEDTAAR